MPAITRLIAASSLVLSCGLAVSASDTPLVLHYNFNGLVHANESGDPDNLTGYRSISDRGLYVDGNAGSLGTSAITGGTGIPYSIVTADHVVDIVLLGDRNTVDNGNRPFDSDVNGDSIGVQPSWLADPDLSGPQATTIAPGITLDANTEIGFLYQVSNGGGSFDVTLTFSDNSTATVTLQGPDWYGPRSPNAPGKGVSVQRSMGTFNASGNNDDPQPDTALNVVEAVLSAAKLKSDNIVDVTGKTLTGLTFSNRTNSNADYAILAATVRSGLGPPANDTCANAMTVTPGVTQASNVRATGSTSGPCGSGDTADVWYKFVAPATADYEICTCGSALDTTLSVYDSCNSPAIACDDNGCNQQSFIRLHATANHSYLIRAAANNGATGSFQLSITQATSTVSTPVTLAYNWNGNVHAGEGTNPDDPNGFRSVNDRGLNFNGGPTSMGPSRTRGTTGIFYSLIPTADTLDLVMLGNRALGNYPFDNDPNTVNNGTQPAWLPNTDLTGPQVSPVGNQRITLAANSQIGLIYNASEGGTDFDFTLGFTDGSSVTVTLNAPDWFLSQFPTPPGPGVAVQTQLGTFPGVGGTDLPSADADLNVVEAIVTVPQLIADGLGDQSGKYLATVGFSNRTEFFPDVAIFAVSVQDPGPSACSADFNGDGFVDIFDFNAFVDCFEGTACPTGMTSDFNNDGFADIFDFNDFVDAFETGC